MSDHAAAGPDGIALATLPAARSNPPRMAEATSPASPEPRTPSPDAGIAATTTEHQSPTQPQAQPTTATGRAWRKVLEVLGYAGPNRSAQRERRRLVQYLTIVVLSLTQVRTFSAVRTALSRSPTPYPQAFDEHLLLSRSLSLPCSLLSGVYARARSRSIQDRQSSTHAPSSPRGTSYGWGDSF